MRLLQMVLFFVSLLFSAQETPSDTAQVTVSGRLNSAQAMAAPYVIMISSDGYRYDYSQKYQATHLLQFSSEGVRAKAMYPSFPSITFPNHWSLVTGLYPAHHGLIDNYFYDYKRQAWYKMSSKANAEDGSWYGGMPLWSLAESQGMLSASMQWVGSASDAGNYRPTYYYHYHEKFSPEDKVQKVVSWLKLPERVRPHFITLYFPEVDAAGHHFGPDTPQTEQAVKSIDNAIGNLVKQVRALGLKNVNYIFVSDHGMIKVHTEKPLEIPEMLLDKNRFDIYNSQTLLRVVVKNPAELKSVYHDLKKNKTHQYQVKLVKRMPGKLHFREKDDRYQRLGQILLIPEAPEIFLEKGKKTSEGKHGYNPYTTPEMKATFYAWGPAFKSHQTIPAFQNVNVYPLVAEILGLHITQGIDGNIRVLQKTLKK
ncbi:ectonucleotide pyrophosphatase/phosphodiesterase [Weeksellaceae bacterium A-14]